MGLREAWVGRGGAQGRLQLPSLPVEGRKEPWLLGSQGRFWSRACGLGPVTAPAFRRCTMTTIRATFAHTLTATRPTVLVVWEAVVCRADIGLGLKSTAHHALCSTS